MFCLLKKKNYKNFYAGVFSRVRPTYRERMRFRIDDKPIQIQQFRIITKQQVQILQGFAEEKRLHHIFRPNVCRVFHVTNRRVPVHHFGVVLKTLENLPAPILVGSVAGQLVHVPQTLQEFRSE